MSKDNVNLDVYGAFDLFLLGAFSSRRCPSLIMGSRHRICIVTRR